MIFAEFPNVYSNCGKVFLLVRLNYTHIRTDPAIVYGTRITEKKNYCWGVEDTTREYIIIELRKNIAEL